MHAFISLIQRFRDDERGMFAIMFGLMAIVLIAMGGAVVDYVSLEQTRTRAQVALDAAALALQNRIFDKNLNIEQIRTDALALVRDRIADSRVEVEIASHDVGVNVGEGSLVLRAHVTVPTIFVSLVGVQQMEASLLSEATRKMLDLEVVMVLDNSGSMGFFDRMDNLKIAAACATNILFYGAVTEEDCDPVSTETVAENVKIGIVPFSTMVNVGSGLANKPWLDWNGVQALAKLNFDTDDNDGNTYGGPVDRKNLFAQTHAPWRGCVEARKSPDDTTDVAPTNQNTKFIPMFAPDTIDDDFNNYVSDLGGTCPVCVRTRVQHDCGRNGGSCRGTTTTSYAPSGCYINGSKQISEQSSQSGSTRTTRTTFTVGQLSERELQERMCKYNGTSPTDNETRGPNANCLDVPILPLTNVVADVQDRIEDMEPDGGTNIQQGTMWGVHALSSTEPLTQGLPGKDTAVSKVLIIMTDGFNEPDWERYSRTQNGTRIYQSWGFRKDGRLSLTAAPVGRDEYDSKADMTEVIDEKTVQTCANAKDPEKNSDGIATTIYTIGLDPPSDDTEDMLIDCSSGEGYYFFPEDPTELKDVFVKIAGQLSPLRLAQ